MNLKNRLKKLEAATSPGKIFIVVSNIDGTNTIQPTGQKIAGDAAYQEWSEQQQQEGAFIIRIVGKT